MKNLFASIVLCALAASASAQFSGSRGQTDILRLREDIDKIAAIPGDRNLVQSTPDANASAPLQPLGSALENLDYPVAPRFLELEIEKQRVRMAYMDAASGMLGGMTPFSPNQRSLPTVLLLHGKNFGGFYFENVMRALTTAGYRVLVPDQIGFGKSSKPDIDYSFDLLADNTARLLDELKIERVSVLGHSMGGMLATRFALKYSNRVNKLVLENPIGLEDYSQFIPAQSLETVYQTELGDTDAAKIRALFRAVETGIRKISGNQSASGAGRRVAARGEIGGAHLSDDRVAAGCRAVFAASSADAFGDRAGRSHRCRKELCECAGHKKSGKLSRTRSRGGARDSRREIGGVWGHRAHSASGIARPFQFDTFGIFKVEKF